MSIFSRLHDIIHSNINALLDKAEDPQKLIRLVIQEMEDTLVEVRSDAARLIADKKQLQHRIQTLEEQISDWESKATFALSKDRDDLARAALKEKHRLEHQRQQQKTALAALEEQLQRLNEDIHQLQAKLDDAHAKSQALSLQRATAQGRFKAREKLHDQRIGQALERLENMEYKIDKLQGQAEAFDLTRDRNLKQQFEELESQDKIEQELIRLKSRLAGQQTQENNP